MKLHVKAYNTIDDECVITKKHELYVLMPVNTETGEVDNSLMYSDDVELPKLKNSWEWRRFKVNIN